MLLKCPKCGGNMLLYMETPLCPDCDYIIIIEFKYLKNIGWIK